MSCSKSVPFLSLSSSAKLKSVKPIGVFDSGVGGLSILKEVQCILPCEDFLYVGDIEHAPYGNKSLEYILSRAIFICDFLLAKQVKAIVVACNTATVSVVNVLRAKYDIPIIGVEPAIKPAALYSKTGHVGVLATQRTILSTNFNTLMDSYQNIANFHTVAAHGLVEQIEKAQLTTTKTKLLLQSYINNLSKHNIDCIVLGCTHYPFIKPLLKQLLPPSMLIFDTATPVAKELSRRLHLLSLQNTQQKLGSTLYFSSTDPNVAAAVMSKLLNQPIQVFTF